MKRSCSVKSAKLESRSGCGLVRERSGDSPFAVHMQQGLAEAERRMTQHHKASEAQLALPRDHDFADKPWIEPEDLRQETLISYPVDRNRLDIFSSFLEPAGVEPATVRNAELTTMMIQLVASGRGVACLPNWALHEYRELEYVVVKSLGEEGIWPTLYAAVRKDEQDAPFIVGFVDVAKRTCFANLVGIVTAEV